MGQRMLTSNERSAWKFLFNNSVPQSIILGILFDTPNFHGMPGTTLPNFSTPPENVKLLSTCGKSNHTFVLPLLFSN
jgi:hypothetical protein